MKTIWEDDASSGGSPETNVRGALRKPMMILHEAEDECNSTASSSIGEDSDADRQDDVQSRYSGFDDAIQALEQSLPIRRGISTFYNGKSKSFTCLTQVWPTSSVQGITKAENCYTRKRRNLGAFRLSYINTRRRRIQKKHKTAKLHFTIDPQDPDFAKHATRSQINRSLALRSFSMVDLHQTKIRNC